MDIITEPNKILHQKLEAVPEINPKIKELISAMRIKMVEAQGVGLAANQVGENLQVFVIDKKLAEENKVPDAFINPEISEYSREKDEIEEGCLSLPDYFVTVPRSKKIKIKALDENGKKVRFKAKGFLARVLQHETDHLNGLLIKDRA
ncbi:MAG: peptide deformylase [Candidatus Yanofskybacteria bacterium RIFCSPHIGHO2_02_FULL_43_15c]|uniref:Peptide deformylase n=1 Tax=Candidatus Yanofskybacteria bacterium RIFCSPHIGHO2_02_FULL_43_15c TaxID=1802679 RepID=A0A1F8FIR0_9BACT|nr:MAG: peptide deformylase [Candidatus Yanofskybacteria bacterium RIFCSPHIGHO2_02_FULL_43_15c]